MKSAYKLLLAAASLFLFSCKDKDKDKDKVTYGTVQFKAENKVGNEDLVLENKLYLNANGDTFKVTKYAYYLSNLQFVGEDNSVFDVPNSYYLIDHSDASTFQFSASDVPSKKYTKVRFTLGIDSTTNVSGAQTGALDPLNGMYWDWNTGYINAKFEGFSPQSTGPINILSFHLGGYSGEYSAVKVVELPLPQTLVVTENGAPVITLKSDILEWFKGSPVINFANTYSVMTIGSASYDMSERYKNHLSVTNVQN